MLNIDVKFVARELTPGLENTAFATESGTTIRHLIELIAEQNGVSIPENNFARLYPMFNGKPVAISNALTQDGTLHVCRVAMGG